eukprot:Skav204836  [mRNA]  locus=scaffold2524:102236:104644:+ [translate_table: standard]
MACRLKAVLETLVLEPLVFERFRANSRAKSAMLLAFRLPPRKSSRSCNQFNLSSSSSLSPTGMSSERSMAE